MITSTRNPRIAAARRLRRSRERRATGHTTVEGPFLLGEAISAKATIHEVFARTDDVATAAACHQAGLEVTVVSPEVLEALASSVSPRGPVAIVSIPASADLEPVDTVVLWGISDPGNAGTIVRTAGAFGFHVAVTVNSVDLWSPKVVRSGVGGHFRTRLTWGLPEDPAVLLDAGLQPLVASAAAAQSAEQALATPGAVALIIGNEARGVPALVGQASGVAAISLPMPGGADSLNAAVAAGILMHLRISRK